ncbi:cob(I)yrinic acid a,c-diamide adenosyltransferase [Patescibacteria group bacterium]|nr:cob(I)yrinic acid a,c-diamide adenosyltransferase [Patescibacteria group bacterium]MBU1705132.1 cob(I)yrinic acid a,c-diamide adenosyltransferase [Patescibacteria group bacterium]
MKPQADESIKGRSGHGLIQIFTGDGKGKTTAALGEALRAHGAGQKVGIVFFDKGGAHYSERAALDKLGVAVAACGRDRLDPSGRFDFSITDEDKQEGEKGLEFAKQMFAQGFDLVILDEINSSVDLKIVALGQVLALLDQKPDNTELILTGRHAPQEFLDRAHLVTEMTLQKHYFYSGVKARAGLDY